MAIKTNSGNVKHIYVKDKGYCKTVKKSDGTVMWAEYYGTYTTGTLPTGVLSLPCMRTSHIEPTATNKSLSDGDALYYGDTLTWTVNASEGYSAGLNQSSYTISTQTTSEPGINGVSTTGAYATVNKPTSLSAPVMWTTITSLGSSGKIKRCTAYARNDNSVTVTAYTKLASSTGGYGEGTALAPKSTITVGFTTSADTGWCKFTYEKLSSESSVNMLAAGTL